MTNAFEPWMRDGMGYVWLTPLVVYAAAITEQGEIALSLGGYSSSVSGNVEQRSQFTCSPAEAMDFARTIVQAAAMADGQTEAVKRQEGQRNSWVRSRVLPSADIATGSDEPAPS